MQKTEETAETITFDYFYDNENENFLFVQVPTALVRDKRYKKLSAYSKLLYGLLLDRTKLSRKNGWRDTENRVFIYYPIAEIMDDLNCCEQKALKTMQELKSYSLIKTIRQGLNKPNKIYVMNFSTPLKYENEPKTPIYTLNTDLHSSETVRDTVQQHCNTGSININVTQTNPSSISIYPPSDCNPATLDNKSPPNQANDTIDIAGQQKINVDDIPEFISNKIDLDELKKEYETQSDDIDLLYKIVVDILKKPDNPNDIVRISKNFIPLATVKQAFYTLGKDHFCYILACLEKNQNRSKIKSNIKGYFLASLYSATRTIEFYAKPTHKPAEKSYVGSHLDLMFEKRAQRAGY